MPTQTTVPINQKKADAFAAKMMTHLNGAGLALMTAIAHRTGLFDRMAEMPPSSSSQIAKAANLEERYVREALGAFVTGGYVEYDAKNKTYFLPPEHAGYLTRKAAPSNMAATMQFVSVLGAVEDDIVECFKKGSGVPYEKYHRFHEVMAEESQQTVVLPLLEHLLPLIPDLPNKLREGIDVLDIGCGSGFALCHMAQHFPASRFTGYDFCEPAVKKARERAAELGLKNITFETRDAAKPFARAQFDFIVTFDAIHDQANPASVLKNIFDALRPGGDYLMQEIASSSSVEKDIDHPIGPFLYTISCLHCMTVSLAHQGAGLGAMWGRETAKKMLREAGFSKVEIKKLDHDIINDYYVIKKL